MGYASVVVGRVVVNSIIEADTKMSVVIPDEILHAARMTEEEFKQEIALFLFEKNKLTLAQASRLAGVSRLQFQHLLASRQIPVHYDVAEFEEDLRTLQALDTP
jgi:predicted HTH domain antitoxin